MATCVINFITINLPAHDSTNVLVFIAQEIKLRPLAQICDVAKPPLFIFDETTKLPPSGQGSFRGPFGLHLEFFRQQSFHLLYANQNCLKPFNPPFRKASKRA
eukprot:TRINITY_DN5317_c0_g1_i3.p1 TRINITY_DN5317_c0_g1~~TRINITY_DN5317_c0_g1_i3.p1  ORF type:complete len:103 (-),score=5.47 TRINITY_DN5317_c0_g1_i3:174-482(-)